MKYLKKITALSLLAFLIFGGCGHLDLTPQKHRIKQVVYNFQESADRPVDVKLSFATYHVARQFESHLGETPLDEFCCGRVQILVTDDKPEIFRTGERVEEFAYPQDHSYIWRKKLFDNERGIYYNLGKHLADTMFPPYYSRYEKAKHVAYMPENRKWFIFLPQEDVYEDSFL